MRTIGLIVKRNPRLPPRARRVRRCAVRTSLLLAFVATAAAALDAQRLLTARTIEPRAFGYQVGDVVSGTVRVHVPNGLALDEASLPKPGARGKALELRSVVRSSAAEPGGRALTLTLDYQVFLSPAQTRTLETPTLSLRFLGQPHEQLLRIEPWPVTVAPLAPGDVSPRRGLGELQPDELPPLIDTSASRWRLLAEAGVVLLLLAYLAHVYIGAPWWARAHRPFNRAWRDLRRLSLQGSAPPSQPQAQARAAIQGLHAALNASAGEVVFEAGIDRFVNARPRFKHLRDDLVAFLQLSSREFFAPGASDAPRASSAQAGALEPDPLPWLIAFCRRCRDAERGSA